MEVDLVGLEACPQHLQCQGRVFLIQSFQHFNDLSVDQIAVTAAYRHSFLYEFVYDHIIHMCKKLFDRIFITFLPHCQHDFIALFPAFIHFQNDLRVFLQVSLLCHGAIARADGKSRQKCRMFSEITGKLDTLHILIHFADIIHHFP